ncbi:MAG: hypothetical protein R3B84_12955 [Zavarzinella sp.]
MNTSFRISLLAVCLAYVPALPATEPDLSTPTATVQSFFAATKANDLEQAKACWMINDHNESGILEVAIGMSITSRKLTEIVGKQFGAEGGKLLGRWRRAHCSDLAINYSLERLALAKTDITSENARVIIPWQDGDGEKNPAFFMVRAPLFLRQVEGKWKLDANIFLGTEKPESLFQGDATPWKVWRDERMVMESLISQLEAGSLRTVTDFEKELQAKVTALKAKYASK